MLVESYLDELDITPYNIGKYCEKKKTTICPYYDTCFSHIPKKDSVFSYMLPNFAFKDTSPFELINKGIVKFEDVPLPLLTKPTNIIQRECFDEKKVYSNIKKITDGLNCLEFPIYHLDFESFPSPLPRFRGEKPYTQSVFQYSLHIQEDYFTSSIDQAHYEFLADNNDCRFDLITKLIKELDTNGTILVWNKSFEIGRLQEFAIIFPDLKDQLYAIINRIFDLQHIVKTNTKLYQSLGYPLEDAKLYNYYHYDQNGSFSIKYVLPVFSKLSYKGMAVSNGMAAVVAYISLAKLSEKEIETTRQDLLDYCKQDTWAMVEILDGLKKMV